MQRRTISLGMSEQVGRCQLTCRWAVLSGLSVSVCEARLLTCPSGTQRARLASEFSPRIHGPACLPRYVASFSTQPTKAQRPRERSHRLTAAGSNKPGPLTWRSPLPPTLTCGVVSRRFWPSHMGMCPECARGLGGPEVHHVFRARPPVRAGELILLTRICPQRATVSREGDYA
jgi:hypothetical protein